MAVGKWLNVAPILGEFLKFLTEGRSAMGQKERIGSQEGSLIQASDKATNRQESQGLRFCKEPGGGQNGGAQIGIKAQTIGNPIYKFRRQMHKPQHEAEVCGRNLFQIPAHWEGGPPRAASALVTQPASGARCWFQCESPSGPPGAGHGKRA